MSTSVFDIPIVPSGYNPENDKLMIHNLSQPPGSSTKMIGILDLLSKFITTDGKVKFRLIDNGDTLPPYILGDTFTATFNEVIIFKTNINKNDFDINDGYTLHIFKKGKGKYRRAGFVDPTAIEVVEEDFIQIYRTSYGDEIYPGYTNISGFVDNGMLPYTSSTDFSNVNHETITTYLERLFHDGLSKLDLPIIDLTWGGQGIDEQRVVNPTRSWIDLDGNPQSITYGAGGVYPLAFTKLGIKINHWASFQQFITLGGEISLLIYRRRYKKRSFTSAATQTPLKPVRWALNKKAQYFGGVTRINITNEMDYYDIHPEMFLRGNSKQSRDYIDGDFSDLNKNKVRREWLGFAFEFSMPEQGIPYITPIVKTLGITKIRNVRSENWPSINIGSETDVQYDIIGYKYQ